MCQFPYRQAPLQWPTAYATISIYSALYAISHTNLPSYISKEFAALSAALKE
ncbi:hypothetical protein B2J93_3100 [Marssonina coronariae]|uniref:Uncharacterized protein n=1 Tax=Diplocarpon coronariae TaxID=2795749 RepID=A0A218Z9U8_9HELO|nr:hypothetical protein B2J93_3100 [Marssonina coronariae]